MLLEDESSSPRVDSPSSSCLPSASALKTLPFHRFRRRASSHRSPRLLTKAVQLCPLVLGPRSSSSVPPLRLSVSRPVRPAPRSHPTKSGASFHLPWPASLDATGAWGSGKMLLDQPLLSAVGTSRARQTTGARIEVSVCAGVRLRGNHQ